MPRHSSRAIAFACWLTLVALVLQASTGHALAQQNTGRFVDKVFADESGNHKYVLFVPRGYTPDRKWPTILYLHSAGERGNDGRRQIEAGLGPFVSQRSSTFPFLVVFPQAEDDAARRLTGWSPDFADGKRAIAILDEVERQYSVDRGRVVLTGWSMGAYGAWSMAAALPERFSAIVPLAGGGDENWATRLRNTPIWAWHGARDTAVFPAEAQRMIEAVRAAGGHPYYTEVPKLGHDIWRAAYASDALYRWMLNPRSAPELPDEPALLTPATPQDAGPFVPALHVPGALHVRLGNELLEALAYSIPERVPQSALQGTINDIYDTTTASGQTFNVRLSGVSYRTQLVQARLKAWRPDRLNVQLALSNAVLSIRGASMAGEGRSAVTGPIYIVIGHRRPVWLSFDVTPTVSSGKLELRLVAADFRIPNDNWYVTPPYGVSTRGLFMTRERVSSGLVSGLYGNKARIEREVVAAIPAMLRALEDNLDLSPVNDVVASFWPLPVYRPRLRAWPERVSTDEHGISLTMGLTAAAIDPAHAPRQPRVVSLTGEFPADQSEHLRVGINPQALGPLTDLLREAGVARIHVLDIPEKTFVEFADRQQLAQALPDLRQRGDDVELWSELLLESPLEVTTTSPSDPLLAAPIAGDSAGNGSGSTPNHPPIAVRFGIPRAVISLALRNRGDEAWTPYADFDFAVAQTAIAQVGRPTFSTRSLRLEWAGEPQLDVSARFAPDYQPQDPLIETELLRAMFLRSWRAWTTTGPVADAVLDDVDLGLARLRPEEVQWRGSSLAMTFAPAGVRISNNSPQPLEYEVRGPRSAWGGPFTLPAGEFHQFEVAYPLSYRERTPSGISLFTLPAGSHSVYRSRDGASPPQLFQAREQVIPQQPVDAVDSEVRTVESQ